MNINRYIEVYSNTTDTLICRMKLCYELDYIKHIFSKKNICIGDDILLFDTYELDENILGEFNIELFDSENYSIFLSCEY